MTEQKNPKLPPPGASFSTLLWSLCSWVCFAEPRRQSSSPAPWNEQSPPSSLTENKIQLAVASLPFSCRVLVPLPSNKHPCLPVTLPYCNVTLPQGEGLRGTLYMQIRALCTTPSLPLLQASFPPDKWDE